MSVPTSAPGFRGINDDGQGAVDDDAEIGWPGSDDVGYRFILNGHPFNGRGQNPAGVTGLNLAANPIDPYAHIELQPNAQADGHASRWR